MATSERAVMPGHGEARDYAWLVRNASRVGLTNVALLVLGVGQSVLLARLLGPTGKGEVYIAVLTVAVVAQLTSLSAGAAIQYHLGKGTLQIRRAWGLIVTYVTLLAAVVGIGVLLYALLAPAAAPASTRTHYTIALLGVLLLGESLNELVLPFFVAADLVQWRTVAETGQRVLMLAAAGVLLGIAHRGITGAIEAYTLASIVMQSAVLVALSIRIGMELPRRSDHARVLGFGIRQHTGAVTARALKRVDSYVLWYFMGPAAVGVYSVASSLAELLLLLPRAVNSTLISFVSSNDLAHAIRGTRQVLTRTAQSLGAGAALFALIGFLLLPVVYGASFNGARTPFVILSGATALLGLYVIGGAFLVGTGRPHVTSAVMMASAVLNIALSLWLIPRFGLVGNAVATLIASAFAAALIIRQVPAHAVLDQQRDAER